MGLLNIRKVKKESKVEDTKKYMVYVSGKSSPKNIHTLDDAVEEAKRLSERSIGLDVHVVEVVKTFKSRVIVEEAK